MLIDVTYDLSVSSAPAAFETAITYVVNLLDTTFSNPVTLNIDVGWGEIDGTTIGAHSLGESLEEGSSPYTYSQVRNALIGSVATGAGATAAASLPATDPTSGGSFNIGRADAKALGLVSANSSVIDGWVGFESTANTFTFDPNNRVVPGEYDFIGTALHEITEVMGRDAGPKRFAYSTLDLFRYSSPGVRDLVAGQPAYFSIDGGVTNFDNFNTGSSGDEGDWAASAGNDFFLAFSSQGVVNAFSAADLTVMQALGWNLAVASVNSVAEQPAAGDVRAGTTVTITLGLNVAVTVTGAPSLSLNDGGTADYSGGSGGTALTFLYTVGLHDANVASLAATGVSLNGGTIDDANGNAAILSLTGLVQSGPEVTPINPIVNAPADPGHAIVALPGLSAQYALAATGDGTDFTITDETTGIVSTYSVTADSYIAFANGQAMVVASADNANVARLYVAALGRAPDQSGLDYWENIYSANVTAAVKAQGPYVALAETPAGYAGSLSIAAGFTNSVEFQNDYGSLTNTRFVNLMYENVLGRAPLPSETSAWLAWMTTGDSTGQVYSKEMVLVGFAESPENIANSTHWLFTA